MAVKLTEIGFFESCYPVKFGTPRQSGLNPEAYGFLHLHPSFQPHLSLQGLEKFTHLWVLFQFHLIASNSYHAKVHPPRLNGESVGVFASRSPHRPNPIGLSVGTICSVEPGGVLVQGLDLVDQTPIFDLKPYLPQVDSPKQASQGWAVSELSPELKIDWTELALNDLEKTWGLSISQTANPLGLKEKLLQKGLLTKSTFKAAIEYSLQSDPRPLAYKKSGGGVGASAASHFLRLYDWDIEFEILLESRVVVKSLKLL